MRGREDRGRLTFLNASLHHRVKRIFFSVENPGWPPEHGDDLAAQLEQSTIARDVAVEHADVVVGCGEGLGAGIDHVLLRQLIEGRDCSQQVSQGHSLYRHDVAVQQAG